MKTRVAMVFALSCVVITLYYFQPSENNWAMLPQNRDAVGTQLARVKSSERPPAAVSSAECEERIRRLADTLEPGCLLRDEIVLDRRHGTGEQTHWIALMRELGIREAWVTVRVITRGEKTSARVYGDPQYQKEYCRTSSTVTEASELRQVRETGLDKELREEALREAEPHGQGADEGCADWSVHFQDDPCLRVIAYVGDPTTYVPENFEYGTQRSGRESLQALLGSHGDVNSADECGFRPLVAAAALGDYEIVKALIERGAAVDTKDVYGWTPLMGAAKGGNLTIVKTLLAAGADVNLKDKNGHTALVVATDWGHPRVAKMLKRFGGKQSPSNP